MDKVYSSHVEKVMDNSCGVNTQLLRTIEQSLDYIREEFISFGYWNKKLPSELIINAIHATLSI